MILCSDQTGNLLINRVANLLSNQDGHFFINLEKTISYEVSNLFVKNGDDEGDGNVN